QVEQLHAVPRQPELRERDLSHMPRAQPDTHGRQAQGGAGLQLHDGGLSDLPPARRQAVSARAIAIACAMFGALAAGRAPVRAQNREAPRHVRGRVVLIAGADLHVELSEPAPLQPGDTLVVRRDATTRGALVVVAADSLRALTSFAGTPFALTRGETFEAELRPGAGTAPAVAAATTGADTAGVTADAPARADSAARVAPLRPPPPSQRSARGARVSG